MSEEKKFVTHEIVQNWYCEESLTRILIFLTHGFLVLLRSAQTLTFLDAMSTLQPSPLIPQRVMANYLVQGCLIRKIIFTLTHCNGV
jgi:hypothetical protein